jgi:hypothetical protein
MKVSRNPKVTVEGALRVGPDAEEVDLAKDLLAPLAVVVGRERKRPIRLVRFLGFCEFCHVRVLDVIATASYLNQTDYMFDVGCRQGCRWQK